MSNSETSGSESHLLLQKQDTESMPKAERSQKLTKMTKLLRRFLTPQIVSCFYYFLNYRGKISPKSEVEVSANFTMGPGCTVGSFTKIKASDGPLQMGERCGIANGCFIAAGAGGIRIGDNFICGPNVVITANNYVYNELNVHLEDQGQTSKGIKIGNNVWIGAGSVILDGTILGDNTIVVANSLVNRRYPANSILQGNPAKVLMKRSA